MNRSAPRPTFPVGLLPLMLLAFALRIWGLADHNIWWDEGIGVWLARMSAADIVHWTAGDVHPPLYYLLLHFWWRVAGEGEFVLRFPAVCFSLLTVAVTYRAGRVLGGTRVGLLAALLVTLSRFAIGWAQEIRMYSLAALWSTGILGASLKLWRHDARRRDWCAYVLTTAGALYTLYLTALVPLVANVGFLAAWWREGRPRRKLLTWSGAQILALALVLPWLGYALPQMHSWSSDSDISPAFFVKLYATMLTVGSPLHLERYTPLTLAIGGLLLVGVAYLWRTRRGAMEIGGWVMLVAGLILPATIVYLVSSPTLHFYYARPLVPRYLLPLAGGFYLLLAWAIVALSEWRGAGRWLSLVTLALTLAAALLGLKSFYPARARRDDYATIAAVLTAYRRPDDAVLLYVDRDWPIFVAHYPGPRHDLHYGAAWDQAQAEATLAPWWEKSSGAWLVQTPESLRTDPQQTIPQWLAAHAVFTQTWVGGENSLTFYARTADRAADPCAPADGFTPPALPAPPDDVPLRGVTVPQSRYLTGDTVRVLLYWDAPPQTPFTLTLHGPAQRDVPFSVWPCLAALPLTPDLPGGTYRLALHGGAETLPLGKFTLLSKAVRSSAAAAPAQRLDYRLGDAIHLLGYELPRTNVAPGANLTLRMWWRTTEPLQTRYKVFAHVVGETFNARSGNFLWGQQDSEPQNGQAPTTLWAPGTVIADAYHISLPDDTPPGVYTIEVGMYGLVDPARLPVFDAQGRAQGDAIQLTTITVVQK